MTTPPDSTEGKVKTQQNKDLILICHKCDHRVYLSDWQNRLRMMLRKHCPACGEEPDENWIFGGFGKYEDCKLNKI